MVRLIRGECLRFAEAVRLALPLMAQMDVPRCMEEMRTYPLAKQREWAHRSRAPLRLSVGLYAQPQSQEVMRLNYGHDSEVHTVLCLTADLIRRLPTAADRIWSPGLRTADLAQWNPVQGMHFLHSALAWAEAAQDRELDWNLYPL